MEKSSPITPEGPAATRCERCARERGVEYFSGTAGVSCFGDTEDCYRIGCERLAARLVEVERERDDWKARTYSARTDAMLIAAGICEQDNAHHAAETLRNGAALALSGLPHTPAALVPKEEDK